MKIGFLGMLTLIFITLKLTKVIAWSWLVVLSPMIIGTALFLVALILAVAMGLMK